MDLLLCEIMLVCGDVDVIIGFYFILFLNLNVCGIKDEDINVMMYLDYGVCLYGNIIIVFEIMVKQKLEVIKGFLCVFVKVSCDVMVNLEVVIKVLKECDGFIDEKLELCCLKLVIVSVIVMLYVKVEGYGQVYSLCLMFMVL